MKNKKKRAKKETVKEKIKKILQSYKTIIYISFFINIVLLAFSYYILSSNHIYTFSGSDEYLSVKDGMIILNTDINILNGNNIQYVNSTDYDIKSYKIGYYVMDKEKLVSIVESSLELDTEVKLSDIIDNFTSFTVTEKNKNANYFTKYKKDLIEDGIYLVLEAKTKDGKTIFSKVKLNVSKISRF